VLSMSLGGPGVEQSFKDTIDVLADEGVTVVVAAGNEYSNACEFTPAFVPSAITVGATAFGDVRDSFSNWGPCLDIWAPGTDILSSAPTSVTASENRSGTSMACPHVSGAAALLLEENSSLSPGEVREMLINMASKNYIEDLSPMCANEFLYVGSDAPQPNLSRREDYWPSDEFFGSCAAKGQFGPMGDHPVCRCARPLYRFEETGTVCYDGEANEPGCPIGAGMAAKNAEPRYSDIDFTLYYFLWNCTSCMCRKPPSPVSNTVIFGIIGACAVALACVVMVVLQGKKADASARKLEMTEVP